MKIYGRRPNLLLNTIKENNVTKIIVLPTGEDISKILNSLCNVSSTLNHNKDHREGIIQYNVGINKIPMKVDNQFKGKDITEVIGSNTENKLVITFNIYC